MNNKLDKIIAIIVSAGVLVPGAFFIAYLLYQYVDKNPSWITYFLFSLYVIAASSSIIAQSIKIYKR
jgi:hypothetical protein